MQPTSWSPIGIQILHTLHGPGFAILALLILWYLQNQCRSNINYVLAGAIAMGIGVASEIAQIPGTRDAQIEDLVVDALGILGALGVSASLDRRVRKVVPRWLRLFMPALAGAALAVACIPTLWFSHALVQQKRAFPTLLTFENRWETAAFGQTESERPKLVEAPAGWPSDGAIVARARESGRWGILLSMHPLPDWTEYKTLSFIAASIEERISMDICIKDKSKLNNSNGNLSCRSLRVDSTPRLYSIAIADIQAATKLQPFDIANIDAIVFSVAKPGTGSEVLFDDIRLEH